MRILLPLVLFGALPLSAASFITSATCSIQPTTGTIITSTGSTGCALSAPVTDSMYQIATMADMSVFGNSLSQTSSTVTITEASNGGAYPRAQATAIDLISLAIDTAGPLRQGLLSTSILSAVFQNCEGCGPSVGVNVNGVAPNFGLHPPDIPILLGSTSVITASIVNHVAGSGFFAPGNGSAQLNATFSFFENDGVTPVSITV